MEKTTKRMITPWMIRRLHVLYAKHGLNEEQYRGLINELTDERTDTTKELTYSEAQYLAGYITGANVRLHTTADDMAERSQVSAQRGAETLAENRNRHNRLAHGEPVSVQPSHSRETSLPARQRRTVGSDTKA